METKTYTRQQCYQILSTDSTLAGYGEALQDLSLEDLREVANRSLIRQKEEFEKNS